MIPAGKNAMNGIRAILLQYTVIKHLKSIIFHSRYESSLSFWPSTPGQNPNKCLLITELLSRATVQKPI